MLLSLKHQPTTTLTTTSPTRATNHLLGFHSFELTFPPDDHLEDLPTGKALERVGQEDGEGEEDAADVHLGSIFDNTCVKKTTTFYEYL